MKVRCLIEHNMLSLHIIARLYLLALEDRVEASSETSTHHLMQSPCNMICDVNIAAMKLTID